MPSSVGHALAGYAATRLLGGRLKSDWIHVLAATAPDLDIVASVLRNRPIDYRNRRSHSAGAALAAGVLVGGMSRLAGRRFLPSMVKSTASFASHLVLDYYGKEAEDGLPLLWPFSMRRMASRRPVFRTIYSRRGRFFSGLFTARNMRRIGREVAILAPLAIGAALLGSVLDPE